MQKQIESWLKEVIIKKDLCPFAKAPFEKELIRINVSEETSEEKMLDFFLEELDFIQQAHPSTVSNSLVCFSKYSNTFENFYEFVNHCEYLLEKINLDSMFQLVCFHPDFRFKGTNSKERVNLVNSSPCALIHILRSTEVEFATKSIKDPEAITKSNEIKLNSLTIKEVSILYPWKSN